MFWTFEEKKQAADRDCKLTGATNKCNKGHKMSLQENGKGTPRGPNACKKFPSKCTLNPATKFKGHAHSARPVGAKVYSLWASPYLRNSSFNLIFSVLNTKYVTLEFCPYTKAPHCQLTCGRCVPFRGRISRTVHRNVPIRAHKCEYWKHHNKLVSNNNLAEKASVQAAFLVQRVNPISARPYVLRWQWSGTHALRLAGSKRRLLWGQNALSELIESVTPSCSCPSAVVRTNVCVGKPHSETGREQERSKSRPQFSKTKYSFELRKWSNFPTSPPFKTWAHV